MGFMIVLATRQSPSCISTASSMPPDTATMTPVYEVFLLGLVAHVLIALLAPIFYAGKDTRTPVTAALVAVAVDVAAAVVLFPFMQLEGLALAIGLGAWSEVILLVALMETRIGFDLRPLARHAVAFAAGGCVASAATLMAQRFVERSIGGSSSLVGQVSELSLPASSGWLCTWPGTPLPSTGVAGRFRPCPNRAGSKRSASDRAGGRIASASCGQVLRNLRDGERFWLARRKAGTATALGAAA